MKIISETGTNELSRVYIAEPEEGRYIEFVESVQPPLPKEKKWVLIVSTLYGCPVNCLFCDCGGNYEGKLSTGAILAQIDFLVRKSYKDGVVPVEKFKIQFARMGEPSLNMNVLDALEQLPYLYRAKGLTPCISTIAPNGTDEFFSKLLEIKRKHYENRFQLQFSIHSTDEQQRDILMPVKKWSFNKIAEYSKEFCRHSTKKVTLNFALSNESIIEPKVLVKYFPPETFIIKLTPVNPTYKAHENGITSLITKDNDYYGITDKLQDAGYETIVSIGEWEENRIGSNCGQYLKTYLNNSYKIEGSYNSKS